MKKNGVPIWKCRSSKKAGQRAFWIKRLFSASEYVISPADQNAFFFSWPRSLVWSLPLVPRLLHPGRNTHVLVSSYPESDDSVHDSNNSQIAAGCSPVRWRHCSCSVVSGSILNGASTQSFPESGGGKACRGCKPCHVLPGSLQAHPISNTNCYHQAPQAILHLDLIQIGKRQASFRLSATSVVRTEGIDASQWWSGSNHPIP